MKLDDYKVVLYRNQPDGWVAEVPAIPGCYALMPTKAEAIQELEGVFDMIAEEFQENGQPLPMDTTAIVHA
jgi:predicted RNase H-like HicB family nuclease